MAKLLSREEAIKFQKQKEMGKNPPRWFLLSYDAGEEIRAEKLNEKNQWVLEVVGHKHTTDDFRKVIIRTLRTGEVLDMDEPAETAIFFLDPRTDLTDEEKLEFWEKKFDDYELDFYYIIAAVLQYKDGTPLYAKFPDTALQKGFQKLLNEVLAEEE